MTDAALASTATGPPPGMRVRLSSNESAFGPSPRAVAAVQAVAAQGHRYPDDQSEQLRAEIAAHESVTADRVSVGTGSTSVLMDAIADAVPESGEVLAFDRSFVVYRLAAANLGATYVEVPTRLDRSDSRCGWQRDVGALLDRVNDRTRVVVVDNPGNPTGSHLTGEQLAGLVEGLGEHVTVIIDEAYHHFATGERGYARVSDLEVEHPRLLAVRTFSKAYALAGLRIGYAIGASQHVAAVDARRARFNVTAPAQAAALASLRDREHVERTVSATVDGRARMVSGLEELGVRFVDGLGNFLTIDVGGDAAPTVDRYAELGVGVRGLAPYGLNEHVRVTVGTHDEIDAFLEATQRVLTGAPSPR